MFTSPPVVSVVVVVVFIVAVVNVVVDVNLNPSKGSKVATNPSAFQIVGIVQMRGNLATTECCNFEADFDRLPN